MSTLIQEMVLLRKGLLSKLMMTQFTDAYIYMFWNGLDEWKLWGKR